mmetsp:Transcript_45039/g.144304  ORF Transcript_45039/g.144304 Transcript_45039/m.144304 type:complete len:285 (-) Transcript_45039:112-966(-)
MGGARRCRLLRSLFPLLAVALGGVSLARAWCGLLSLGAEAGSRIARRAVDLEVRPNRRRAVGSALLGALLPAATMAGPAVADGGFPSFPDLPKLPQTPEDLPAFLRPLIPEIDKKKYEKSGYVRDRNMPPKPSLDPGIRKLQEKSWNKEPYSRMRQYLMPRGAQLRGEANISNPFEITRFVRWPDDENRYDIVSKDVLKEAKELGKIIDDESISAAGDDFRSWLYVSPADRDYVQDKLNAERTEVLPQILIENIALVRSRKFGEIWQGKKEGAPLPPLVMDKKG